MAPKLPWRTARILGALAIALAARLPAGAVAFTSRYSHTATLMADRNILVVGGVNTAGTILASVQISLEDKGIYIDGATLTSCGGGCVARSSHTATMMPNGKVLVAGGKSAAATVEATTQLYDPSANSWTQTSNMSFARYNHTATLLRNGNVLICGGQLNTAATPTMNQDCDQFDQTGARVVSATALQAARSHHAATLLKDGKVMLSGGFDPNVNPTYLVTNEIIDPGPPLVVRAASPLIQARANHTATLMGNGKIFIAGGFNGRNIRENLGNLDTTEIYDPVADSVVPARPMNVRRQAHSAVLDEDGSIKVFGGLGNISTTTIPNFISPILTGGVMTGAMAPTNRISTSNITGGTISILPSFTLGTRVTGVVANGDIYFSCPTIVFPGGFAYLVPGNIFDNTRGMRADLAGTSITCNEVTGICGQVTRTLTMAQMQGQYFLTPALAVTLGDGDVTGASSVSFAGPVTNAAPADLTAGASSINANNVVIRGLPAQYVGGKITAGNFFFTSGSMVQDKNIEVSYNISLTSGTINLGSFYGLPDINIISDPSTGLGMTSPFSVNLLGTTGSITSSTDTATNSPLALNTPAVEITGLSGRLRFVVDQIRLDDMDFRSDVATVVIRSMLFSDVERYRAANPPDVAQSNTWDYPLQGFGNQRFNHTATLTPRGDIRLIGGRDCPVANYNVSCPSFETRGVSAIVPRIASWALSASPNLTTARGNHTVTTLPDGRLLIAGGTSGPNILRTSEILDPVANTVTPSGTMKDVRDLHTATLLPNGTVLVAGGFSTNATSTGSINSSEIFYKDTGLWIPTASVMTSSRDNHTATLMADGNVLVTGGYANGLYLASCDIFYSTSGVWKATTPLPLARALHSATLLQDGRILVVGGINAAGVRGDSYAYDPTNGSWTAQDSLTVSGNPPTSRTHSHSATLLLDGRVLVVGGNDGFGETNLSEIFDPQKTAGTQWMSTDDPSLGGNLLSLGRFNHTTMILPNGMVAVIGGASSSGGSTRLVETFNVALSTWGSSGNLSGPRGYHTTTLAKDGKLFNIGGYDGVNYLNTFETTYFTGFPDLFTTAAPPSLRKSSITAVDRTVFGRNELLTATGLSFQGSTEGGGGGAGSANSNFHHPRMVLQSINGGGGSASQGNSGFVLDLSTRIYANAFNLWSKVDSSITVQLPNTAGLLPYGWYDLRIGANGVYSDSLMVQAGPPKPVAPVTAVNAIVAEIWPTSITWRWTAPTTGACPLAGVCDGYNVYTTTTGIFITSRPVADYTATSLQPSTTQSIFVAPYSLTGDGPLAFATTIYTLPVLPLSPAVSSTTADSLFVSWNTNLNGKGTVYEISQSTDNFSTSFSTPYPVNFGVTTNTVNIAPLALDTTFYFRVRAFNLANVPSGFSATVSTQTRSNVNNLRSDATFRTPTKIRWKWDPVSGALNYKVYLATAANPPLFNGSAVFFDDSPGIGLSTNTQRSVQVSVVTAAGEGPLSPAVTAYTSAAVPQLGNPAFIQLTTGSFRGSWTPNDNPPATTYQLSCSSDGFATTIVSTPTTGLAQTVSGQPPITFSLIPAEIFTAQVTAINGDGFPSVAQVLGSTPTLALTPVSFRATANSPTSITVAWDKLTNASSATYQITMSSAPQDVNGNLVNASTPVPFALGFNGSGAVLTGLLTATTYSIRLQGQNPASQKTGVVDLFPSSGTSSGGGATSGSLGGALVFNTDTIIAGNLGNGQTVVLRVPAFTFPSNVSVSISSLDVTGGLCAGGSVGPSAGISINTTPEFHDVKGKIFLTLSYNPVLDLGAIPPDQLALMRFDPFKGKCVPLQTSVNTTANTYTAVLDHLSKFQIAQVTPSNTAETARIFPNPFYASRNDHITIYQVPAFSRVRVFTLKGELVFEQNADAKGIVVWGATNRGGRVISSGVYFAVVEGKGTKKILKLAVIR